MVCAEDVIQTCQMLLNNGIQTWLTGGWGIDALLGEQTRPHKDLDVIMRLNDVIRMREILGHAGYVLHEIWIENRWVSDVQGVETPTAFVLQDAEGRQVDAHAMLLDDQGNGIPAWEADEGFTFTKQDLGGKGTIAGFAVQCLTPEMQVLCHMGYELPEKQLRDLELLHDKHGVEYLIRDSRLQPSG
jgi:lincosamide nucleotidyltransferase A/C/D/E